MDLMSNPFFSFALIVIGFGFLIFVHELGHFLVAKMVGIKTTQFAIGFGHSLLTWRKGLGFRSGTTEPEYQKLLDEGTDPATLGETEYRLNYIPLGGYVKMLGQEDMDPTARSSDPRAFNNKSVSARFAVISAGVIMNIIFGMIFFIIAFMSGVMFPPATVGGTVPGFPAALTYADGHENDPAYMGLQIGDQITSIDGDPVSDILDVKYATILARDGANLSVKVRRDSEPDELTFTIKPKLHPAEGFFSMGIVPPLNLIVPDFKVEDDQDGLVMAGLTKGMRITAVDGQAVDDFTAYHRAVTAARGREALVTLTDPDSGTTLQTSVSAIPDLIRQEDSPPSLLGLVPPVTVLAVNEDTPAHKAGIQPGDLIARIGTHAWPDEDTVRKTIKEASDTPIKVSVWRDGQELSLGSVAPENSQFGFIPTHLTESLLVGRTVIDSPLDVESRILGGSKLLTVNGQAVENWTDFQLALEKLTRESGAVDVTLTYELNLTDRPQESVTVSLDSEQIREWSSARWTAPMPQGVIVGTLRVPVVGDDPFEAAAIGFEKTQQWVINTYMTLLRLTQGTVPADKLSGPIGIVHQGTIIAESGWQYLFYFLGLISINLAVINFLPIPITDGGQAVFLAIEKVKGSPVSEKIQTSATLAGLVLLGCVFLFVTYNDLLRLIG
jgi:regulator of sigma E protease